MTYFDDDMEEEEKEKEDTSRTNEISVEKGDLYLYTVNGYPIVMERYKLIFFYILFYIPKVCCMVWKK